MVASHSGPGGGWGSAALRLAPGGFAYVDLQANVTEFPAVTSLNFVDSTGDTYYGFFVYRLSAESRTHVRVVGPDGTVHDESIESEGGDRFHRGFYLPLSQDSDPVDLRVLTWTAASSATDHTWSLQTDANSSVENVTTGEDAFLHRGTSFDSTAEVVSQPRTPVGWAGPVAQVQAARDIWISDRMYGEFEILNLELACVSAAGRDACGFEPFGWGSPSVVGWDTPRGSGVAAGATFWQWYGGSQPGDYRFRVESRAMPEALLASPGGCEDDARLSDCDAVAVARDSIMVHGADATPAAFPDDDFPNYETPPREEEGPASERFDLRLHDDARARVVAASLEGNATCSGEVACIAVSGTGEAHCRRVYCSAAGGGGATGDGILGVAGTGDAEGLVAAASGLGDAEGGYVGLAPFGDGSGGVAASASGDTTGGIAATGTGNSTGVIAAAGTGEAAGLAALSGTGGSRGLVAASGTGVSDGWVAASGTDDADGRYVAASGIGDASSCWRYLNCLAASGGGSSNGTHAVAGGGDASSCRQYVNCLAVSGAGDSRGGTAVSILGTADGRHAELGGGELLP